MRHLHAISTTFLPARANGDGPECIDYLLSTGDFCGFKDCKESLKTDQ